MPHACSASEMLSTLCPMNAVPSPRLPVSEASLASSASFMCPIVMRDGTACGFMIRSGVMPSRVHGMSCCWYFMPHTPFCPCRDANLSPMSGCR